MTTPSDIKNHISEVGDQRSEVSDQLVLDSVKERGSHGALRSRPSTTLRVALLTGGGDRPYAVGMAAALTSKVLIIDFIGSDDLKVPEVIDNPLVNFLNLRGDQSSRASLPAKIVRLTAYYGRLIHYAATAKPKIFHILWNNKIELFDRTLLMAYYQLLGKKVVLTAHNVNIRRRDLNDSWLNRISLKIQYRLSHHIFVHTDKMKAELLCDFGVHASKVTVVPFGINNTVPNTVLTTADAKQRLGVSFTDKTILFFGNIAPYKGLEYLVDAFPDLLKIDGKYRLVIVGRPKASEDYWKKIERIIAQSGVRGRTIERIEYIPDGETELYFKAADVLVLPYTRIFQSGVLLLGYSFGLPAIAADVGTLREEIVEGETGFVFKAQDSTDLARVITKYFDGELYQNLEARRPKIKKYANECYSWDKVARITTSVYSELLGTRSDNVVATPL